MTKHSVLVVVMVFAMPYQALGCGHRAKVSAGRAYLFASQLDGWTATLNIPVPWCTGYGGARSCDDESTSVVLSWTGLSGDHVRGGTSRSLDLLLLTGGIRLTPWSWESRPDVKRLIPFVQLRAGGARAEETDSGTTLEDWDWTVDGAVGLEVPLREHIRLEAEGDFNCRWNFDERDCAPGLSFGLSFVF